MRWSDLWARFVSSARPTVKRFWASVLFSAAMTTTLILATDDWIRDSSRVLNRLSLALFAGLLASLCAVLFYERRLWERKESGSELTGNLVALLTGGLFTAATYPMIGDFTHVSMGRHIAICLFLFLAFFVVPSFRREGRLEMYVVRLFTHGVISALFAAVAFIGIASITLTISSLFALRIDSRVYLRIWLVMAGVMAPFLFMGGIPLADAPVDNEEYPKTLKNLVVYVVTPIISAYTLVLYVYFAKILVTWQWPIGLVSHLVLWYSIVTLAVLYFMWPLVSGNKWAEVFSRYIVIAVVPLLMMMFLAIGIRIRWYGITENRYYVVVVGLWALASVLYLTLTKKRNSVLLPAALAVIVILSVFGPWSSFAVSKWSQNRRLEGLLSKYNMISDGSIVKASQEIPSADRKEMGEVLYFFDRFHELSEVKLLPAGFTMMQFESTFGFPPNEIVPGKPTETIYYEAPNRGIDISGYRYLFDFTKMKYDGDPINALTSGPIQVEYNRDKYSVRVSLNGSLEWEQSLFDYAKVLRSPHLTGGEPQIRPEDMIFETLSPNLRIKIVVTSMYGGADPFTDEVNLGQVGFYVLVGDK